MNQNLEQAKALVWLNNNKDLAKKFAFHFKSQAKPHSEKLSKNTATMYGNEAWELFENLERLMQ